MSVEKEADTLLEAAKAQTAALMVKARQGVQAKREEAIEKARNNGEEAVQRAQETAAKEASDILAKSAKAVEELRGMTEQKMAQATQFIVEEIVG